MKDIEVTKDKAEWIVQGMARLRAEIKKVIIGQDEAIELILTAFLAGGHALLEGVPGLAKTLMVRTLARAVNLPFHRIQFTPDLMPSDIIGTEILEEDHSTGKKFFKFNKGPLFSNILLADEINRTSPKTQSALLEAMQEGEVSYSGTTYSLDKPFFILATQNPIEQAGTFPLPEAQLDRFLLYIKINYPTAQEEELILSQTTGKITTEIAPIIDGDIIVAATDMVREVFISNDLVHFVSSLVRATRPGADTPEKVRFLVRWGAGPRAGQAIILSAKAHAFLQGRYAVTLEDIEHIAPAALRHRVLLNFRAEAEGITTDDIIQMLWSHHKKNAKM